MERKTTVLGGLAALVASSLGCMQHHSAKSQLAGQERAQISRYVMDVDTFDYIMREVDRRHEAVDYAEFLHFCETYDRDNNRYLTFREAKSGFDSLGAQAPHQ